MTPSTAAAAREGIAITGIGSASIIGGIVPVQPVPHVPPAVKADPRTAPDTPVRRSTRSAHSPAPRGIHQANIPSPHLSDVQVRRELRGDVTRSAGHIHDPKVKTEPEYSVVLHAQTQFSVRINCVPFQMSQIPTPIPTSPAVTSITVVVDARHGTATRVAGVCDRPRVVSVDPWWGEST